MFGFAKRINQKMVRVEIFLRSNAFMPLRFLSKLSYKSEVSQGTDRDEFPMVVMYFYVFHSQTIPPS